MPKVLFRSEENKDSLTVLLTGEKPYFFTELLDQINTYPHLGYIYAEDVKNTIGIPPLVSVIIHFVGFAAPSLSQTLIATNSLYNSLQLADKLNCKFLLVLANESSPVCHTALTLTRQFIKSHHLPLEVLQVDSLISREEIAGLIIAKFIYKHHSPLPPKTPKNDTEIVNRISENNTFYFKKLVSITKYAVVIALSLYLVFLLEIGIFISYWHCTTGNFLSDNFKLSSSCSSVSQSLLKLINYQTIYLPGSNGLLLKFKISLADTFETTTSFTAIDNLLSQPDATRLVSLNKNWFAMYNLTSENFKSDLRQLYKNSPESSSDLISIAGNLGRISSSLTKLDTLVPIISNILGINKPKNYLVIFLDDTFTRSLGGKMDTLWCFTLDHNSITDFQSYSAQNLSQLIMGQVDPPADLKRLTGISSWSFLDGDWNSDFSQSAKSIAWFFNKAVNVKSDLVIAINTSVFPDLLKITGPLSLPSVHETVTADNFQIVKAKYPRFSLIDLTAQALKNRLSSFSVVQKNQLFYAFLNLLDSRQLFISSAANPIKEFGLVNWDGGVHLSDCSSSVVCQYLYIYNVDFSTSDNAAGLISKKTAINIQINSRVINAAVASTYTSSGNNRLIKRIYLPTSAKITSAVINGKSVLSGLFPLTSVSGLFDWGFPFNLIPGHPAAVNFEYQQPLLVNGKTFHLLLDLPNQPGTPTSPLSIDIKYPLEWTASTISAPAVAALGHLRYNVSSREYFKLDVEFKQN